MPVNTYQTNPLYIDRYTRATGWRKLLFVPGRELQAAELIELQSMLTDQNRLLLEGLYANGSIIQGLVGVVSGGILSFSAGQLYYEGYILDLTAQEIPLNDTAAHTVYLTVSETVTSSPDGGADVLVWTPTITLDNGDAYLGNIGTDGVYTQSAPRGAVDDRLGLFLYERYGNYRASGLETNAGTTTQPTTVTVSGGDTTALVAELAALNGYIDQLSNLASTALSSNTLSASLTGELATRKSEAQALQEQISALQQTTTTQAIQTQALFDINPGVAYIQGQRIATPGAHLKVPMDNLGFAKVTGAAYSGVTNTERSLSFTLADGAGPALSLRVKMVARDTLTTQTLLKDGDLIYINSPAPAPFIAGLPYEVTNQGQGIITLARPGYPPIQPLTSGTYTFTRPSPELRLQFTGLPLDSVIGTIVLTTSVASLPEALLDIVALLNGEASTTQVTVPVTDGRSTGDIIALLKKQLTLSVVQSSLVIRSQSIPGIENIRLDVTTTAGLTCSFTNGNLFGGVTSTYTLGFQPVLAVTRVLGTVEVSSEAYVRGALPGGRDTLNTSSLVNVLEVRQGITIYREGSDYQVLNNTDIAWSPSGSEPAPGTSYYVTYTQNIPITDYTLSDGALNFTTQVPLSFTVDYLYSLQVAGVIILDSQGNFSYLFSTPAAQPTAPTTPAGSLAVARFNLSTAGVTVTAATESTALSYLDLNVLAQSVQQTAIELAKLQLQASRPSVGLPALAELFHDLSQLDFSSVDFTAALSPITQTLTRGTVSRTIPLRATQALPLLLGTDLLQPQVTTSRSHVLGASLATRVRVWSTQAHQFVCSGAGFYPCDPITPLSQNGPIAAEIKQAVGNLWSEAALRVADGIVQGIPYRNLVASTNYLTTLSQATAPRVRVDASFQELRDQNYQLRWRGALVSMGSALYTAFDIDVRPTFDIAIGYITATGAGPDTTGVLSGTLNIPPGTPAGNYALEIVGDDGHTGILAISLYNNTLHHSALTAAANWLGYPPVGGVAQDWGYQVVDAAYSPLNQEFVLKDVTQLSGVNIYFRTLGLATPRVILRQENLILSIGTCSRLKLEGSSAFLFPEMVTLPPGRYTLGLEGEGFEVWTGDTTTDPTLRYAQGVLSHSRSGSDLDIIPDERLAYHLISPRYNLGATIDLGAYTLTDLGQPIEAFAINQRAVIPPGSGLTYQYSVDGALWKDCNPFATTCLTPTNRLYLRALLSGTLSPSLRHPGATVTLYGRMSHSRMVSSAISTGAYDQVSIEVVATAPPTVYIQNTVDRATQLYTQCSQQSDTLIDSALGMSRYIYGPCPYTGDSLTYTLALSGEIYVYSVVVHATLGGI